MTSPADVPGIRRRWANYPDPEVVAQINALCDALGAERSVPNPAEWDAMVTRAEDCERRLHGSRMMLAREGPHVLEEFLTRLYNMLGDGDPQSFTQFSAERTEGEDS